ncbi:MAG: hypothetical protein K8R73_03200 [Clostridiales bacterium]|nr:hypothetical protein [Clostridiales bacterium]
MIQKQAFKETEIGIIPEEWNLVKVGEVSEKTGDELVENDTINLLSGNERTVFEEMQAQIKQYLVGLCFDV